MTPDELERWRECGDQLEQLRLQRDALKLQLAQLRGLVNSLALEISRVDPHNPLLRHVDVRTKNAKYTDAEYSELF